MRVLPLLCVLLLTSCVDSSFDDGESSQPIIGGSVVDPAPLGIVAVGFPAGWVCTGTLINNDWVLTARHCADDGTPTRVELAGENRTITSWIAHPDLDLALARLDRPIAIAGRPYGYRRPIGAAPPAMSQAFDCYGYSSGD